MSEKNLQIDRSELASQLVEDFRLQEDADFFSDPFNRLEFVQSLGFDEFFSVAQHVNARTRGFEPRDRVTAGEGGAYLPMLATPHSSEKPEAFRSGFNAVQNYLNTTTDTAEERIRGVSMAVEALVIWVHPFNDGNGRTSRFLGKFIEDGTTDIEQLVNETASNDSRLRMYDGYLRIDQGNLAKGADLILNDDEIEELKKTEMPIADGISRSLTRLLEDKSYQDKVDAQTNKYKRWIAESEQRRRAA